jgi:hypothetical protein
MQRARLSLVIGLLVRFVDFRRHLNPSPRHNLILRFSKTFRLGGTHWAPASGSWR